MASTIDELARMTAEGFHGVQEQFANIQEQMDKRFNVVGQCFDQVDKRFDGIEKRLELVEHGQEEIKYQFRFAATKQEVRGLDQRVTHLEKKAKFA